MTDRRAQKICSELIRGGTKRGEIDTGVYFTDYSGPVPQKKMVPGTAGDGDFQPQECYARAIEEAENDMVAYGGLLRTCNANPKSDSCQALARFKQKVDDEGELGRFKRELPWLFTDFNPLTINDDEVFARVMARVSSEIESTGLACSLPDWPVALTRRLERILTAPAEMGGFGIKAVSPNTPEEPTVNTKEQTALQAIASGVGDCSEFGWVFYGLSILAGPLLNAKIMKTIFDDGGDHHVWIGIEFYAGKGGEMIVADTAGKDDSVRAPNAGEAEITPLQFLAAHYNNMGLKPPPNTLAGAGFSYSKKMFGTALRYDPSDPVAHYNLGNLYFDKGLYNDAEGEYKRAIALNGRYADAYYNLALVYEITGRDAAAIDARADYSRHSNGE